MGCSMGCLMGCSMGCSKECQRFDGMFDRMFDGVFDGMFYADIQRVRRRSTWRSARHEAARGHHRDTCIDISIDM